MMSIDTAVSVGYEFSNAATPFLKPHMDLLFVCLSTTFFPPIGPCDAEIRYDRTFVKR